MSDSDLEARLDAVERALTDDETDIGDVREAAARSAEIERLQARVADLEQQVDELDAALQAVRGYAGNVRAVNRDVERRASAALAKAEALETRLGADDPAPADRAPDADRSDGRLDDQPDRQPANQPDRQPADQSDRRPPEPASATERPSDRESGLSGVDRADPLDAEGNDPLAGSKVAQSADAEGNDPFAGHESPSAVDRDGRRPESPDRGPVDDGGAARFDNTEVDRFDGSDGEDDDSGTEQFIERVRNAL